MAQGGMHEDILLQSFLSQKINSTFFAVIVFRRPKNKPSTNKTFLVCFNDQYNTFLWGIPWNLRKKFQFK